MASTSAESIFQGAGGGNVSGNSSNMNPGTALGVLSGPYGAILAGASGAMGSGTNLDRYRLDEDPFVKAAKEADERTQKALDKAKDLKTTTDESGTSTTSGSSKTTFDPRSGTEQQLLDASVGAYGDQKKLVDQQSKDIEARSALQTGSRDSLGNVLSGDAFNLSAGEQGNIDRLRQSNIDASSNAVNDLLTQRLGEVSADAARRGVRGQAFSQLQGDAVGEAAKSLERSTLDANKLAAQQAIDMPAARVGIQAGTAGKFADFGDQLQQQAIQNRQQLQDPVAMQALLDERLKGGSTDTTGTTATTGKSTKTGLGQEEILGAQANLPGSSGAKTGAFGSIFGGVMGAAGG